MSIRSELLRLAVNGEPSETDMEVLENKLVIIEYWKSLGFEKLEPDMYELSYKYPFFPHSNNKTLSFTFINFNGYILNIVTKFVYVSWIEQHLTRDGTDLDILIF